MGNENPEITALTCRKCGGGLVKSYRVEYDDDEEENVSIPIAKCSACGQEYDRKTEEYYGVFSDELSAGRDSSVFRLGIKGKLKDVEYEIIGRIRYQDEEEWEKDTWDEWFAVAADGTYHYFVEEEGEVHSYEDYTPQSIDLESGPAAIEFEGKKIPKSDAYTGRVVFAEGELPWKPETGEAATMYDFKKDGARYTVEQSEGEVSITRGELISYGDIVAAFGGEKEKESYARTVEARTSYRRRARIYLAGCALCLAAAAFNCFSVTPVVGIMKTKMELESNAAVVETGQAMYQSSVLYGPFDLPSSSALYSARVSVNQSAQKFNVEWQSFRLLLVPEERLIKGVNGRMERAAVKDLFDEVDAAVEPVECYMFGGDFWDEEGYDDGYWHESDLSVEDDFILEKAGTYYAYLELSSQKPRMIDSVEINVDRTRSSRYYLVALAILALLYFFNRSRAKTYSAMPFAMASD